MWCDAQDQLADPDRLHEQAIKQILIGCSFERDDRGVDVA
jgi:hypothetical protein